MRVLRTTIFPDPRARKGPVTIVVRDSDIVVPLEEMVEQQRFLDPGSFVITDIFDMPDSGIEEATRVAYAKRNEQDENNMAMLFAWTVMALATMKPAHIKMNKGAPLTVDQIVYTFEAVAHHPDYQGSIVETHSIKTGATVTLDSGVVTVGSPSRPGFGRYRN